MLSLCIVAIEHLRNACGDSDDTTVTTGPLKVFYNIRAGSHLGGGGTCMSMFVLLLVAIATCNLWAVLVY